MTTRTLDESDYTQREYYDTILNGTTDGLFSVPVRRLKKMVVQDSAITGQDKTLVITFKDKPQA